MAKPVTKMTLPPAPLAFDVSAHIGWIVSCLFTLVAGIIGITVTHVKQVARTEALEVKMADLARSADHTTSNFNLHRANTLVHIDPQRDERRWSELNSRLDKLEDLLDTVIRKV